MLTLCSRQTSWVKKLVKAWKQMRGRRCFGKKNKESKLLGVSVKVKKKKKNRAPVHTMKAYGGVEV